MKFPFSLYKILQVKSDTTISRIQFQDIACSFKLNPSTLTKEEDIRTMFVYNMYDVYGNEYHSFRQRFISVQESICIYVARGMEAQKGTGTFLS